MRRAFAIIIFAAVIVQASVACAPTASSSEISKAATGIRRSPDVETLWKVLLKADLFGLFEAKRFQDSRSPIAQEIIQRWQKTVPALIDLLDDAASTRKSAICYWSETSVGDIALVMLLDLLTSDRGEPVIPGLAWDVLLERKEAGKTAETVLREYVAQNGRASLKSRFQERWRQYSQRLEMDGVNRTFRLKEETASSPRPGNP